MSEDKAKEPGHDAVSAGRAQMEAVTLIGLLADEERLRVVGAVALGHDRATTVAEAADLPLKQVVKHLARLAGSGLLEESEGRYRVDVGELRLLAREGSQRPLEEFDAPPQEAVVLRRFIRDGKLISIPLVRSKRLVILDHLAQEFEPGQYYTEAEVNETLAAYHPDVASLRRHLVDENFMTRDLGIYWRSGGSTL
jgi:hypothetical protein